MFLNERRKEREREKEGNSEPSISSKALTIILTVLALLSTNNTSKIIHLHFGPIFWSFSKTKNVFKINCWLQV